MTSAQGLQEKFFKAVQDGFGAPHKKKKNLNKTSMARLWNASKIHGAFLDLWTDIPAEHPLL